MACSVSSVLAYVATLVVQERGPGLGNLTYDPSELFQPVDVIVSTNGHGMTTMVNGYLLVPDVGGLMTFDGSHLDAPSAERWTRAFFAAAEERLSDCLARSAQS